MNLENKVRILTRGHIMKFDENGNEIGTDQKEPVHIQSCTVDDKYYRLRGEANDLASELENSLDSLLQSYFNWNPEKIELLNRFMKKNISPIHINQTIKTLDFMKCRNLLSQILKKDKRLNGRNGKTKILHKFIMERNKYAHGLFGYLHPDGLVVLQYEDENKSQVTSILTEEILNSFIKTYHEMQKWFDKKSKILHKLKEK